MAERGQLAHCSHCGRARQLDDGFWKNLVDINVAHYTTVFAKPREVWERYGRRAQAAWAGSLTVTPDAGVSVPVPSHAGIGALRMRGVQLAHDIGLAASCIRLQSHGSRVIQWLRRELGSFTYFSRI
jgi:hypothetical protein